MKDRMSRDHKKRKEFKVDQMLCTAEEKYPTDFKKCMENFNYMSLMFIGVFDKSMFDLNSMNIEVFITNTMNRRRTNRSMVKPILVCLIVNSYFSNNHSGFHDFNAPAFFTTGRVSQRPVQSRIVVQRNTGHQHPNWLYEIE